MAMMIVKRIAMASILAVALAACGGGNSGGNGGANNAPSLSADGENLAFSNTTLTVPTGQVTVTFNNSSTANQHNWVLVKGGDDVAAKVDEEAVTASDAGYIPQSPDIVSSVKLLNPGEKGTASFTGAAGTYTYICTVPGHYAAGMKGTLTVQ